MLKNRAGSKYSFQKILILNKVVCLVLHIYVKMDYIILCRMFFADVFFVFIPRPAQSCVDRIDTELSGYVSYT